MTIGVRSKAFDHLVLVGYRDIVVTDHREGEIPSGYQPEYEQTTIVARDPKGLPRRMRFEWWSGSSGGLTQKIDEAIDESDLERARASFGGFQDTLGVRDKVEADERERVESHARWQKERDEYERKRPECPKCGAKMESRTRRSDGSSFWGCSRFSRKHGCDGTRPA